jgi:hypothetical protein
VACVGDVARAVADGEGFAGVAIYISDYLVNGGEHVRGCVMPFHRNIVAFDCKIGGGGEDVVGVGALWLQS